MSGSRKFVIKEATRRRCKIIPCDEVNRKRFVPISLELFSYLKEAAGLNFSLYFRNEDEIIEFVKPRELSNELLVQMWNACLIPDADVEICLLKSDYPKFEATINASRSKKIKAVLDKDPTLDVNVLDVYSTLSAASQMIVRGGVNSNVANKAIHATTNIVKKQLQCEVTIGTISRMIQCDSTLYDHSASVAMFSAIIASRVIKVPMDEKETLLVAQCGLYHDAGKACVPNHVLNKPGSFTKEEFEIMKTHTIHGHKELVKAIQNGAPIEPIAARVALEHHERFTGNGYPYQRKGRLEENENGIHLYTRIVTIADVYSALLMKRVYKEAMSSKEAIELMSSFAEKDFDLEIFKPFYDSVFQSIDSFKKKEENQRKSTIKMIDEKDSFIEAVKELEKNKKTG